VAPGAAGLHNREIDDRGCIVSCDFAEKDLAHIGNVLSFLECSVDASRIPGTGAVIDLNYWRARVRAVLAMPRLPAHVEKQAKDLLGRLDRLEDSRRCATSL
jgi:hypothetical protein